jgi:hypothetical protein
MNKEQQRMKNSFTHPSTPVFGYLYGSSRVDGLPIHPPVAWATPVEFTVQEVLQWHLSKQHGDSRWFLGAALIDGRQVWLIRSHQNPVTSKYLKTAADSIHKNRKGFRGNANSMLFIYDAAFEPAVSA